MTYRRTNGLVLESRDAFASKNNGGWGGGCQKWGPGGCNYHVPPSIRPTSHCPYPLQMHPPLSSDWTCPSKLWGYGTRQSPLMFFVPLRFCIRDIGDSLCFEAESFTEYKSLFLKKLLQIKVLILDEISRTLTIKKKLWRKKEIFIYYVNVLSTCVYVNEWKDCVEAGG